MLLLLIPLVLTFADSTQLYYSEMNEAGLERLCAAPADLEASLLCRYRLYPLTQDERHVRDLPAAIEAPSARALALLSGLWGYRAARAALPAAIRHGFHSDRLLRQARALDPDDPFVLLVEGQSLLFRPKIAGGDRHAAMERFRQLREVVRRNPHDGVSVMEAELWIWYTLHRMNAEAAPALRHELLARKPPALYRQFLQSPP